MDTNQAAIYLCIQNGSSGFAPIRSLIRKGNTEMMYRTELREKLLAASEFSLIRGIAEWLMNVTATSVLLHSIL